eukprot:CAMPEP_0114534308 /NCGR_PEP_ID=MMETSP0109-20121206/27767_1 /TAXON_ID=29199 /ORGANISM="Chlorarachnion reptans, Strain CCCM449" /LENGTH=399 /DNA_ID=CAMNT_0001717705 /DNA_START=54 /DNA_END=1253 /DNA_ORIENTATION=+
MNALVFNAYGKTEDVCKVEKIPRPEEKDLKPGEMLIKVQAAALNPIDIVRIKGGLKALRPEPSFPAVVGFDVAGEVIAVKPAEKADGVEFKVGDEVAARMAGSRPGSVAEYAIVSFGVAAKKPKDLSWGDAASLGLAGQTAIQAFRKGEVKEGDKVFISGGAGGVGTLAIQLAKKVFKVGTVATTASPGEKSELCKALGADVVINYKSEKFEEKLKDYDFAFDTTGEADRMCSILKPGKKVVSISGTPTVESLQGIGMKPGLMIRFFLWMKKDSSRFRAANTHNVKYSYLFLNPNAADMKILVDAAGAKDIRAVIDSKYKLIEGTKAVSRMESGRCKGKVVIFTEEAVNEPKESDIKDEGKEQTKAETNEETKEETNEETKADEGKEPKAETKEETKAD